MSVFRRLAAACLAAAVALPLTPGVAGADSNHQKLRKAQAQAHRLDHRAQQQAGQVDRAGQRLARLDARANAALDRYQTAKLAADRAQAENELAQQELAAAQAKTDAARATLYEMAAGAYRTLAGGGQLGTTLSLVESGDPQQFVDGLQLLGRIGNSESQVVDEFRLAEADEIRSEHIAAQAAAEATTAAQHAQTAKDAADRSVARQQQEVRRDRALLASTRHAAAQAHHRTQALQRKIERARARALAIQARQAARAASSGLLAKCDGSSVAGYPNGQLPVHALCPLWGAPGEALRSDAAGAFNQLSHAYAQVFGVPLCVTASYRTYQRQVELYASMPAGYAAVPGTSNHGWGLAVDLCGGIQVDGSPEHAWLLDHAASYNWFHPSWALPGGPGPHEPWHWEYAG
jgi:zinc D-Ala-D-Ala carboxypeptidase